MGRISTLLCATGLTLTLSGQAIAQDASTVLATVNGTEITLGHMIALQERLPEQYKELPDDRLYDGMLEQLIQQTALSQEIEKNKTRALELGLENEMRAFLAGELLAQVGTRDIPVEDIEAAYADQFLQAEPEQEFNASHILVESEEEAKALVEELSGGADFAELAKEHSTGPSGPRGGLLGWFGKGAMVPEFEAAVLALEKGAVSDPVQTQFGWHVVMLNDLRTKDAPSLDAVRSQIEQALRSQAIDTAVTSITADAEVTRAEVEVDPSMIRKVELLSQ